MENTTVGCDFGGLLAAEVETYNLVAEGGSTGDDVTDVRPGDDIAGNFQRIATPELNVAVKSIGATDTAVKNSDNVNLLRFEARAGEAEDILATQFIFTAGVGSLQNAQDYTLWFDADGDGVVDTIAQAGESVQNSNVTFDDLTGGGVLLPAEETVLFEVHGDISSSLASSELRLRFATGATSYVEAEEADNGSSLTNISLNGSCGTSPCEIVVTTVQSKLYSLVNQGDLFVTLDSTPTRSRQLLGGTLGDTILRLQFRAQNEDVDVTDLQLTSSGSNASSIDRLELYKDGATTAFATATVSGCGSDDVLTTNPVGGGTITTFCANMENGQLVVKDGENLDVLVKPRLKSDEQGALSGQPIQLWVSGQNVSDNGTGSGAVRARGRESSSNLTANDDDQTNDGEVFIGTDTVSASGSTIRSNNNDVVLSKITTIANANPDADNTNVPTGISPIGQFKFTAASNSNTLNGLNKATLSGVIFNVTASQVDLESGTFKFYNKANADTKATCVVASGSVSSTGSLVVSCPNLRTASSWTAGVGDTQLESGETNTFVLEVNIQNAKVGSTTSSLQVSLQDFTTRSTTTYGPAASHIDWTDEDSGTVASGTTTSSRFKWVEYSDTVVRSTSYKS